MSNTYLRFVSQDWVRGHTQSNGKIQASQKHTHTPKGTVRRLRVLEQLLPQYTTHTRNQYSLYPTIQEICLPDFDFIHTPPPVALDQATTYQVLIVVFYGKIDGLHEPSTEQTVKCSTNGNSMDSVFHSIPVESKQNMEKSTSKCHR